MCVVSLDSGKGNGVVVRLDCGKKMVWYKDGLVKFRHKEVTEF